MAYNLLEKFEASYQEIGENNEVNEKPNLNYLKNLFGLSIQEVGVLSIFFHLEQKIVPIKSMEEVIAAIEPHIPNENSISLILHELADRGLIKSSQGLMNKKDFGLSNWLTKAILKNDMEAISRNLPKGLINAALMIIDALYYERSSAGDMDRIEKANLKLFPLFGTIRCLTHSEFDVEILFSILCFELSKQPFTIGMIGKLNAPITWIERTKEEFSKAEHYLIKENLVTMNGNALAMMGDEDKIPLRLTDFAKMQLITPFTTAEEKAVFARASMDLKVKTDSFGIVRNSEILPLNLVFNEELKEEIDLITQLVQPDHFKTYQEEIGQEQTKKGVAMIFSGPPGTGKTSLAHFLAKNSC
ncbi:MAG: AAA family ATPase, partial [Crocinitomicaceae bacterium]